MRTITTLWRRAIPQDYVPRVQFTPIDFALAAGMGCMGFAWSLYLFHRLGAGLYVLKGLDIWFQADPPRVFSAMVDPLSKWHYRTSVHPIFSLMTSPVMHVLRSMGVEPVTAGSWIVAANGFLSCALLLLALRALALPRSAAVVFCGVFLVSATFIHWFALIETYSTAITSISVMLLVLTRARRTQWWAWWLASAATLSATVTNWMLGLSCAFFRLDWRRMLSVSISAFVLMVGLSMIQRMIYPTTGRFFSPHTAVEERNYTQLHRGPNGLAAWTPLEDLRSIWITSAVAPPPQVVPGDQAGGYSEEQIVTNQKSPVGTYTLTAWIAIACWVLMLASGAAGGWGDPERRPVFLAVTAYLLGQTALHLVYGPITFLYAGDFFPAMILLAGLSWFSPLRTAAICAGVLFVIVAVAANLTSFDQAVNLTHTALGPS